VDQLASLKKKTTNFNACRDLTGRRIRHVIQEKRLAERLKGDREKKEKKNENVPNKKKTQVNFKEEEYQEQLFVLTTSVSNAFEEGIQNYNLGKRKRVTPVVKAVKLTKLDKLEDDEDLDEFNEIVKNYDDEEEIVIYERKKEGDEEEISNTQQEYLINNNEKEVGNNNEINDEKKEEESPLSIPYSTTSNGDSDSIIIIEEVKSENKEGIDLNLYESAKQLEQLGSDKIKEESQRLGLLVGGSPEQRAERLFSTKNLPKEKWSPSILVNSRKSKKNNKKNNKKKNKKTKLNIT